jgi:ankyrin repeat protein
MAAFVGNKTVAYQLLESGANVDARARGRLTALHIAVFMGYKSVAKLLLKRSAHAGEETRWYVEEHDNDGCGDDDKAGVAEPLCNKLHQLVCELGSLVALREAQNSFNVQHLAAIGGNIALKRLVEAAGAKK